MLELAFDTQASHEFAGRTVAICVGRGIGNILPPRKDPWFGRRLRRAGADLGLLEGSAMVSATSRSTKVEMVLAMLPTYPAVDIVTVDLGQSGPRLRLLNAGSTRNPSRLAAVVDGALMVARDSASSIRLRIGPGTATLALIALSNRPTLAENVVREAMDTVCSVCGGRIVALTSLRVTSTQATVVIPLAA